MRTLLFSIVTLIFATPAVADNSTLDELLTRVGETAIETSIAHQERLAAIEAVNAAMNDFITAETAVVRASDWITEYSDAGNSADAKAEQESIILKQVPLMIAAERELDEATSTLEAASASLRELVEAHNLAKQAVLNYHVDVLLLEANNARALISEDRMVTHHLAETVAEVCNDGIVEADQTACDPYEQEGRHPTAEEVINAAEAEVFGP